MSGCVDQRRRDMHSCSWPRSLGGTWGAFSIAFLQVGALISLAGSQPLSEGLLLLFIPVPDILDLMASTGGVGYKRVRPRLSAVI